MDVTMIVEALIGFLSTLITCFVVPYFKAKYTQTKQENIVAWIEIAVRAAEQIYNNSQGSEKKQYVLSFLQKHNLIVNKNKVEDMIDNAIEASVYQLKTQNVSVKNETK